jgi:recombination protein RecT
MATKETPTTNTPARSVIPENQPRTLKDILQGPDFKSAVAQALPRAMRPERFVRVALNCLMRTPELAECSRESFFRCMLDLSTYGLEPDGRRAHLIPFKNQKMCQCGHEQDLHKGQQCTKCNCTKRRTLVECTLIIDYKGLSELVRRSGDVSYIHADVVYEHDEWSFSFGTDAHLRHKPAVRDRGTNCIAYYSYVRLKDGSEDFMVLSPAEVEAVRKRSKSPNKGPWETDYDEMGKKTAFRRHSKWLPLSPEVQDAIERDEDAINVSSPPAATGWEELIGRQLPEHADEPKEALPDGKITELQQERLQQIAQESGWRQNDLLEYLKKNYNIGSVNDLKAVDCDAVIEVVRQGGDPDK